MSRHSAPARESKRKPKTWAVSALGLALALSLGVGGWLSLDLSSNRSAEAAATPASSQPVVEAPADKAPPAPSFTTAEAARMAGLVDSEDRRLVTVKTVVNLERKQSTRYHAPYRVAGAYGYTLVLTPRSQPYTIRDLLTLAPQTFRLLTDGSYLLLENIVVEARAELRLSGPDGLTLRLLSKPSGFVSLTTFGGQLDLEGTEGRPLTITSWDQDASAPDLDEKDGRSYIRIIGGQFTMHYTFLEHLGFWSGRTGGLALTGTDRPDTGNSTAVGKVSHLDGDSTTLLDELGPDPISPAGPLPAGETVPGLTDTVPSLSYVSTEISGSRLDGNAYGLFVTGALGVQISDTTVTHSLLNGVILHRYVQSGVLERVRSTFNVGDGFNIDRATTGIVITDSTAEGNEQSGVVLSGRPLAEGPNVTGSSTIPYGNNALINSQILHNGHFGVEVLGGFNIGVTNNEVVGNDMGIVVTTGASRVTVIGNKVRDSKRYGVSVTGKVDSSTITGNIVDGAKTGIYLRDSTADVETNTIKGARSHGVSVVGDSDGAKVQLNALSGAGQSALDRSRANGHVSVSGNGVTGWHDTSPWYVYLRRLLHPITILWFSIIGFILTMAFRGRKTKGQRNWRHPYEQQALLSGDNVIDLTAART